MQEEFVLFLKCTEIGINYINFEKNHTVIKYIDVTFQYFQKINKI